MKGEHDDRSISGNNRKAGQNSGTNDRVFTRNQAMVEEISGNSSQMLFDSCLVDHSMRQFACIHGQCAEKLNCFMNIHLVEEPNYRALRFHPEDRKLWCEKAFPDILRHIDTRSELELPNYMFSFNHRYIRSDGSISQFLHEGFLTYNNVKSLPVLNVIVFTEIGDIKTDDTIVLSIFRYSDLQGFEKIFTQVYADSQNQLLTSREIEIVRLCHQGLSSKMIADKLDISIHTVKNHKRHCMEKTLTHNITELIHYCLQNHWI